MKKIIFLPLDERPCNEYYPKCLFGETFEMVTPPAQILGRKKTPASYEDLKKWLLDNAARADGAVIAIDTLLYGGIIPSRLHFHSVETLKSRLDLLDEIKKLSKGLKLYAFSLIMRCPRYSSNDEEPDYYGVCGKEIFQKGDALHRRKLGLLSESDFQAIISRCDSVIPDGAYEDFMSRRAINGELNLAVIDKLKSGVIDFLLIPQDDAAVYGHTALDQERVRGYIKKNNLQSEVYMYPGADEIGLSLLAKLTTHFESKRLRAYVRYSSHSAADIIPLYEDRPLGETIKYQLLANGCIQWDNPDTADLVVLVNSPTRNMRESDNTGQTAEYDTERTLIELVEQAEYFLSIDKPVTICDVAYANGGDLELAAILNKKGLLLRLAGYAGWNTSSNTLGTAISQGVQFVFKGATKAHLDFLALRYVEDFGYCAFARESAKKKMSDLGIDYLSMKEMRGEVSKIVKTELETFISECLTDIAANIRITDCYMPWKRMFEVGLKTEFIKI